MSMDLAFQAVAMQAAQFQQAASLAVMKKSFEMQKMTAQMLVDAAPPPAPPSGQGLIVDKRA